MNTVPYVRLSGFYFFYFALLGALVPYWTLYLQSLDFSAQAIGLLMALLHGSRIVAPNIWGWLADKTGQRVRIVKYGAFFTGLTFVAMFGQSDLFGVAVVMLVFSFFWNAILPQFEVLTLSHLGAEAKRYSQIRLWGSIGFIVTVTVIGALLDFVSIGWLPHILLFLMVLIWLNTLLITEPSKSSAESSVSSDRFLTLLMRAPVIAFFFVMLLIQLSHGPYYTFYSVMLEGLGYDRFIIGCLWSLGVLAEVVLFIYMPRLLQGLGMRVLLISGLLLTTVRWLVIAWFSDSFVVLLVAQLLHAASFGIMHAVGIALVHYYFTEKTYGQAQALFSSVGFGFGGALGALLSGMFWEELGAAMTFTVSGLAALLGMFIAWKWIDPSLSGVSNASKV